MFISEAFSVELMLFKITMCVNVFFSFDLHKPCHEDRPHGKQRSDTHFLQGGEVDAEVNGGMGK